MSTYHADTGDDEVAQHRFTAEDRRKTAAARKRKAKAKARKRSRKWTPWRRCRTQWTVLFQTCPVLAHVPPFRVTKTLYNDSECKIELAPSISQRQRVILSTKVGTHADIRGYTADHARRSLENSLLQLRTDHVELC